MAGHTRTRTGCWTCREAGYKCDEQKPHCGRCVRLKKECKGYGIKLKWKNTISISPAAQAQQRSKKRGVSVDHVDSPMSVASLASVTSIVSARAAWDGSKSQRRCWIEATPAVHPSLAPGLSLSDRRLLHYWLHRLSSLISIVPKNGGLGPFQIHLASLAYGHGALQSTVLSMAASHLALVSGDRTLKFEAYKHQRNAIHSLQNLIQDPYDAGADSTLATVMMMQVSARLFGDEDEAQAANHLTGAKAMIIRRGDRFMDSESPSVQFLLSLFAYHDILSSVSRGSSPLVDHGSDFQAIEGTASTESIARVLQVVARISNLQKLAKAERLVSKQSNLSGENYTMGAQIQEELLGLSFESRPGCTTESRHVCFTAEAYRHAAFIYLYRVWLDTGAPNPITLERVQQCLTCIEQVPVESSLTASHTWPLFTAGCEAINAVQRQFVRQRFQAMYNSRKFPSLKRVLRDVEDVWAAKDAEQVMGGLKVDCIEVILARRGREVDLA